ncbi:hypothetical protein GZ77_18600 [Endozoicomonas montiporae]|uniref:Uncharacterized protein n=2 Tax=Endozoicomonas montiporae TaxID=1027273 RepID=A0A081N253_9GAMM|nr:hypothetical protein GZ77_18600 [Endozoicomonas montiporae]
MSLYAYSPNDQQGTIYAGLQNLNELADILMLERKQELGTIGKNNLIESLLSPWDESKINELILNSGDIKTAAKDVVSGIFRNPLYDLSGLLSHKEAFLNLIENSSFLSAYVPAARGITLDDTDALFVPSRTLLTKNLNGTANTATDQKSSSTLIPANTPVFILGQLRDRPSMVSAERDSWLLIWRKEFGLKFVRSGHIGRLSEQDIEKYKQLVTRNPEIVRTERVEREFKLDNFDMLMPGTMPLYSPDEGYFLAKRNGRKGELVQIESNTWFIYRATLDHATLRSIDEGKSLTTHIKHPPMKPTVRNYLDDLHNVMFHYPIYVEPRLNEHRSFSWGEGITGIDNLHGVDTSNFVYKLVLGFGLRLPRHSADQIAEGMKINKIYVDRSKDTESHYQTLVEHCTLGRMAAFANTGHLVCIGSVSMAQLSYLDKDAGTAALNNGIKEGDLIPLVATSPVGFSWHKEVDGKTVPSWTITPKAAVFPIFKKGPYSSWVSRKNYDLTIFSFFENSPKLETRTEL